MVNLYLYLRHFPANDKKINGGLVKAVHGLASGLVNSGAKVTVLSEASAIENSVFQTAAGYEIRCFANPIQKRPAFRLSPQLKQFMREQPRSNSIAILNGILHPSVYAMSRLCKKCSIPYIVAPHDLYHPSLLNKNPHLKYPYWYLFEQTALQQAAAIQVLDTRQEKWIRRLKIRTPVITTPNGFDRRDQISESSLLWNQTEAAKFFFLGRLDAHHKGLDLLLEAFDQAAQNQQITLTIQGPGRDKQWLQKQAARLTAKQQIMFLNGDFENPPASLIQNYDVLCLPSRFEGFGLSALEAMMAGRVLLVSEVAGIAPHVEASDCGVVVTPDVAGIQAGMLKLLERRSQWQEMGLRGRRYALEHLRWDKIGDRALQEYQQILGQPRASVRSNFNALTMEPSGE